jgi:hypothetical protein
MPRSPTQLLAVACACLSACSPPPTHTQHTSGALPQKAYVWHHTWTPEVQAAVLSLSPSFHELVLLAGEIKLTPQNSHHTKIHIPWPIIPTNTPLSIAIRIQSIQGPYNIQAPPFEQLHEFIRELITDISPYHHLSSIHLDFDCPASKLKDYKSWIRELKQRLHSLPITITALPSWTRHRGFAALAQTADHVVLQVHGLHLPTGPDAPFTLCDPEEASRAVESIAQLQVPFTAALPTYGYQLLFNQAGELIDVVAEEPGTLHPDSIQIRETWTDPKTMTELVQLWTHERPMNLHSIIWYRLPVTTDQRNWTWPTLHSVMQGIHPSPQLQPDCTAQPDGSLTVTLSNLGTADARDPCLITATWTNATLLAAECLPGFAITHRNTTSIQWSRSATEPLRPGETTTAGWITTSPATNPRLHLQ